MKRVAMMTKSWIANSSKIIKSSECRLNKIANDPSKIEIVIYHGQNCTDGFAAAFAAYLVLGDKAQYIAAEHGPNAPSIDVTGKNVAIIDYCFSKEIMQRMISQASSLIILDHHASAQEALSDVDDKYKVFEMAQSGASLAWNYFHGEDVPLLFRFIEDKDIWRWALKDSEEFSAAFSMIPLEFSAWKDLLDSGEAGIQNLIEKGSAILSYKKSVIDSHVSRAVPCRLKVAPEFNGLAVNGTTVASEIGNAMCQSQGVDYGLIWSYEHATHTYRVSLRSDSDRVDVSKIAKHFGGGGHRRASGFSYSGKNIEEIFE
jgi:uncharacterized protein